jgi:predicted DCC family thiol-disulfide oxidoreductase YuxK
MGTAPEHLIVLYDEQCALCRRCREWLEAQPTLVTVEFLAAGSPAARSRFGDVPWLGADLVVADLAGNVWAGAAAFLMCLWATAKYRTWSYRLSSRTFAPLAEWFFHVVSSNRGRIGAIVGSRDCPDGRCKHRADTPHAAGYAYPTTYQPPVVGCARCGAARYGQAGPCWSCGAAR